jgi:hypothetical protein
MELIILPLPDKSQIEQPFEVKQLFSRSPAVMHQFIM